MVKVERIPDSHIRSEAMGRGAKLALKVLAVLFAGGFLMLAGLLASGVVDRRDGVRIALQILTVFPVFGAVSSAAVAAASGFIRSNTVQFNVTATADADVTATIPHTLAVVPDEVYFMGIDPAARISLWVETIASRDATNVVLTKATTAGSGAAGVQLRVIIKKPHTVVR